MNCRTDISNADLLLQKKLTQIQYALIKFMMREYSIYAWTCNSVVIS